MNLPELKTQIESAIEDIQKLGDRLKTSAKIAASARADYGEAKHKELLAMAEEENTGKVAKRTIDQRKAVYRNKHSDLRREWMIRENDWQSDRELYRGARDTLSALQTLYRVEAEETR